MSTDLHAGQTATDLDALVAGDQFVLYGGSGYYYQVVTPVRQVVRKGREGLTIRVALNGGDQTSTLHFNRCAWGYDQVMVLPA